MTPHDPWASAGYHLVKNGIREHIYSFRSQVKKSLHSVFILNTEAAGIGGHTWRRVRTRK